MAEDDVRQRASARLTEALALKQAAFEATEHVWSAPEQWDECLRYLRSLTSRLEAIQSEAVGLWGEARRSTVVAETLAEEAWNQALVSQRHSARQEDYTSAAERKARADIATFNQQRAARTALLVSDELKDTIERIKSAYRWVDETRRDMRSHMNHLSWKESMER